MRHRRTPSARLLLVAVLVIGVSPASAATPTPDAVAPDVGDLVLDALPDGQGHEIRWPDATDEGSGIARFEVARVVEGQTVTVGFAAGDEDGSVVATLPDITAVAVRALDAAGNLGEWSVAPVGSDATPVAVARPYQTVLIAGDIATCTGRGDSITASIIESTPGLVMTAGDNAYPDGTPAQYRDCYGPTWGRFRNRTRPALGNHDWVTPNAAGYFDYFGKRAGPRGRGYYAFDAGTWRIYVLDSQRCFWGLGVRDGRSGCGPDSAQHRWLDRDLAANPRDCVMAVWHHPRFSSGSHGGSFKPFPLLKLLYLAGAEVVVNGHDHSYERLDPARPDGTPDPTSGIRQFVVGTGGGGLYGFRDRLAPNSVVRDNSSYGVLRLRLADGAYDWAFLRPGGRPAGDRGSGTCHRPPT